MFDRDISDLLSCFKNDFDHNKFKDNVVVFVTTYWYLHYIKVSLQSLIEVVNGRDDTFIVIIDNNSPEEQIKSYLNSIKNPKIDIQYLDENVGRPLAINLYLKKFVNESNLPAVIVAVDPDITFSSESFDYFIDAIKNIDNIGMLSMRYEDNKCNPEKNVFFRPRKIKGKNGNLYMISVPFLANVPGGIVGIRGDLLKNELDYMLFPMKKYMARDDNHDGILYSKLRWKYLNGFLNDTLATHWRSGPIFL